MDSSEMAAPAVDPILAKFMQLLFTVKNRNDPDLLFKYQSLLRVYDLNVRDIEPKCRPAALLHEPPKAAPATRRPPGDAATRIHGRLPSMIDLRRKFGARMMDIMPKLMLDTDMDEVRAFVTARIARGEARREAAVQAFCVNDDTIELKTSMPSGESVTLRLRGTTHKDKTSLSRVTNPYMASIFPESPEIGFDDATVDRDPSNRIVDRLRYQGIAMCQICGEKTTVDTPCLTCTQCCSSNTIEPARVYHHGCLRPEYRSIKGDNTQWICPQHSCGSKDCGKRYMSTPVKQPMFKCSVCRAAWHSRCVAEIDPTGMPHPQDYSAFYLSAKKNIKRAVLSQSDRLKTRNLTRIATIHWRCPQCVVNGIGREHPIFKSRIMPWDAIKTRPPPIPVRLLDVATVLRDDVRCAQYDASDENPYVRFLDAYDVVDEPAVSSPPPPPPDDSDVDSDVDSDDLGLDALDMSGFHLGRDTKEAIRPSPHGGKSCTSYRTSIDAAIVKRRHAVSKRHYDTLISRLGHDRELGWSLEPVREQIREYMRKAWVCDYGKQTSYMYTTAPQCTASQMQTFKTQSFIREYEARLKCSNTEGWSLEPAQQRMAKYQHVVTDV